MSAHTTLKPCAGTTQGPWMVVHFSWLFVGPSLRYQPEMSTSKSASLRISIQSSSCPPFFVTNWPFDAPISLMERISRAATTSGRPSAGSVKSAAAALNTMSGLRTKLPASVVNVTLTVAPAGTG